MKYNLIKVGVQCVLLITEGLLGLLAMVACLGVGYSMFQLAVIAVG